MTSLWSWTLVTAFLVCIVRCSATAAAADGHSAHRNAKRASSGTSTLGRFVDNFTVPWLDLCSEASRTSNGLLSVEPGPFAPLGLRPDNFYVRLNASVTIPAGTWSLCAASDDGRRVSLVGAGIALGNVRGEAADFISTTEFAHTGLSAGGIQCADFTVTASSTAATLTISMFQGGGGASLEACVAPLANADLRDFGCRMLMDGVYGWRVHESVGGAAGFVGRAFDLVPVTQLVCDNVLGGARN